MDTAIERIRAKISELEARIGGLRIAERELQAVEKSPAKKTRVAAAPKARQKAAAKAKQKRAPQAAKPKGAAEARQTIGAAITEVLVQQGAISAAEIAEHIKATGRDISNRTVSFALQALKKRGLAKNTDGRWAAASKGRALRARPGAGARQAAAA
jgi:hypothetical protein